ncbi:hypothetical protein [Sphingomonas sp. dw_22]|uniref:hypothetical protein n=1 Tax=Sphingomonas sp. dw_22 TaxID=2721175 RepID=UPI001BD470D7|nr:hypothetical protein [Sphingomonas sp. dw_22]
MIQGYAPAPVPDALVLAAARRWREARDGGRPVQRALHTLFEPEGCAMLAPVFDSLMRLCESRFDHKLCTGCVLAPSVDEHLLCRLLADPSLLDRIGPCRLGSGMDRAFACALHSTRIMLSMIRDDTQDVKGRLQ